MGARHGSQPRVEPQGTVGAAEQSAVAGVESQGSLAGCLEQLYHQVSPGGIIQFDDYGHRAGARNAVDEFFRERAIPASLHALDYSGRQFIKPPR